LRLNSRRNTFSVSRSRKLRITLSEYYRFTLNATQEIGNQRQAVAIYGCGVNAFSRHENRKTKPPLSLVKLLIALDRHPISLNEVRGGR
jgi:hypothetical protein